MRHALWFLIRLGLLTAAVLWVAQHQGTVEIAWRGYVVETSVGFVAAGGAVFLVLYTILYRLWRSMAGTPDLWRRYVRVRRREEGYRAVTAGFLALAAGDAQGATACARRGQKLIPDAPLTRLLDAQAHLLRGDLPKARLAFAALADDKDAAFFGVKALLQEAVRAGDFKAALIHARRAAALQPRRPLPAKNLFDLEARNREWARARGALETCARLNVFRPDDVLVHRQALMLAEADDAAAQGRPVHAHKRAAKAFSMNPGFIPAALRLAGFYVAVGKDRAARQVVLRAFAIAPHPGLAKAWMDLRPAQKKNPSPYRDGKAACDWARRLYETNPDHAEAQRMMGAAAMEAGHFAEARDLLIQAADYSALAKLERMESGSEAKARVWLEKAAEAPPAPVWACLSCGQAAGESWVPLCPHCGVFNNIVWVVPRSAVYALPPKAEEGAILVPEFSL